MSKIPIQPLWLTYFIEILLVLEFQLTKLILARFLIRPILDPKFPLMKVCLFETNNAHYIKFRQAGHV